MYTEGAFQLKQFLDAQPGFDWEFAELAGIRPDILSHIKGGRKNPTLQTAFRIERATGGRVDAEQWTIRRRKPRQRRSKS